MLVLKGQRGFAVSELRALFESYDRQVVVSVDLHRGGGISATFGSLEASADAVRRLQGRQMDKQCLGLDVDAKMADQLDFGSDRNRMQTTLPPHLLPLSRIPFARRETNF